MISLCVTHTRTHTHTPCCRGSHGHVQYLAPIPSHYPSGNSDGLESDFRDLRLSCNGIHVPKSWVHDLAGGAFAASLHCSRANFGDFRSRVWRAVAQTSCIGLLGQTEFHCDNGHQQDTARLPHGRGLSEPQCDVIDDSTATNTGGPICDQSGRRQREHADSTSACRRDGGWI